MTDLREKRVLVAEDDYFLAQDIKEQISRIGATVIGPAASLATAFALARTQPIDLAILDINLGGKMCFPIAAMLSKRGIPYFFVTGHLCRLRGPAS